MSQAQPQTTVKSEISQVFEAVFRFAWENPHDILMGVSFGISVFLLGAFGLNSLVQVVLLPLGFVFLLGFLWRIIKSASQYRYSGMVAIGLALVMYAPFCFYYKTTTETVEKVGENVLKFTTTKRFWNGKSLHQRIELVTGSGKVDSVVEGPFNDSEKRHGKWIHTIKSPYVSKEVWYFYGEEVASEAEFRRLEK